MQRFSNLISKMSNLEKLLLLITALIYIAITFASMFYINSEKKIESTIFQGNNQQNIQHGKISKKHSTMNHSLYEIKKEPIHELSYYNLTRSFDETCNIKENPNFVSYIQNQNLNQFYNVSLPNRTYLGQAKNQPHKIMLWRISNYKKKIFSKVSKNVCFLMNSLNIVTQKTIKAIKTLLNSQEYYKLILATDANDIKGNKAILQKIGQYVRQVSKIQVDSDYKFINRYMNGCERLVYGFGHFVFDQFMVENIIQQATNLQPLNLIYTSSCFYKNKKKNLTNLLQTNLQLLKPQQFYEYLYIFDPKIFQIITPLNFAYYSKYNFDQILLLPVLAIFQQSSRMRSTQKSLHAYYVKFGQFKETIIKAPVKQDSSYCFVSYPNNPYEPIQGDISNYLSAISEINKQDFNVSLVISAPYNFKNSKSLFLIVDDLLKFKQKNQNIRIRLRIRGNKTVSSIAVYQAVYSYCPSKSMIISTRHNIIKFNRYFLKSLSNSISEKYHYYFVNIKDENKNLISFQKMPQFIKNRVTRTSNLFEQKFKHIQIFKNDLMKSNSFWMLKSQQIDFYQTQSCFITQMMQSIKLDFYYINETLVQIITRNITEVQKSQIENVKKFAQFGPLPKGLIVPYRYDCLENPVHRRFATEKMERNIHQIWIGADKISSVRWRLFRTVKQNNPNFKVFLWTNENITQQIVPYTYKLLKRILEHNKQSNISMYAMAADLLRYQLCMRFGGLYIDFKFQALKPLDNFLKYQIFLLDYDIQNIRFGNPRAAGIGVMGCTKNNYHMNFALTEIINEYTVPMRREVNVISGGFALRKSLNQEQLMNWVGLGYHLVVPLPYQKIANECGGVNKTFDSDQEVVEIIDVHTNDTVKFGIPCRAYPQAYLIIYNVLGGTWVRPKSFVN